MLAKYVVSLCSSALGSQYGVCRDIKMYQDTIAGFGVPALIERFEFIRQLGNVFLVRPEILKSYITENYLGRIDPTLLKPYLALRSDWGQFEKGFNDANAELLDDAHDSNSLSPNIPIRSRFGRLSVMMKDLEGMKLGEGISMGMPSIPTSLTQFSLGSRLG